jgi:hypothetical protein
MIAEKIMGRWAALLLIIVFLSGTTGIWWNWKNGRILVQSSSSKALIGPILKVRDVPSSTNPLWMFVSIHSRFYRCEYYRSQNSQLFSSQSFEEDSFIAQKVEVRWDGLADATVLFDGRPTLRCQNGWWKKIDTPSNP